MKVCEHDNLQCPYCGSKKQPLSNKITVTGDIHGKAHELTCADCMGVFWVTCED